MANHPNRKRQPDPAANPKPAAVLALRERIQKTQGCGITAAQDMCAALVHTSRRAWQQWETGERRMHPAFFELANIKVNKNAL